MGEWVRDTKRSQTQSVSPRGPPPLAGHTLPVDQKDRGREGESGRVGEGHKEKPDSVCVSTGRVGVAEGHKEKPNSVCVNHRAQGDVGDRLHAGKGEGWLGGLIGRAEWKRENDREMKTTMIRRRAAVSDQPGGVGW